VPGVPDVAGGTTGNAFLELDFVVENVTGVTIPETDIPPSEADGQDTDDPHGWVRQLPVVWQMTDGFFRQGSATNDCPVAGTRANCTFPPQ
jgi:hypothetical protein